MDGLSYFPDIMMLMKVEIYPTLERAVESLKKGEGLYTDSRFLLDPVRVVYKREARSVYKATGLDHGEITWSIGGEDKIMVSSHREKDGKKYVHASLLKGEELVRLGDTEYLYKSLILKTEELEELIDGLISLAENNKNMFKKPMMDILYLGLKRINVKNKDFLLIEDLREEAKRLGISDFFRKQIVKSKGNEDWKKRMGSYSLYIGNKAEKELHKTLSNLTKEVETDINWKDVLVAVDKAPGSEKAKIITELWEDKGILGVEIGGDQKIIQELGNHFNKYGKWGLEKSFPNLLGKVYISTSNLPKREKAEFALVPLEVEEKEGTIKVDYLALVKLKIEDKKFLWLSTEPVYFGNKVNIKTSAENSIRIVSKDAVSEIMPSEEEERKNKKVLVKANFVEEVEISPYIPISVKEVGYRAIRKGFTRAIYIGENPETVEDLKEIEDGKTMSEIVSIRVFLKRYINPRIKTERNLEGGECLGKDVDELIAKEMKTIASDIEKFEKEENDNKRKGILKTGKLLANRISRMIEEKKAVKSKCYHVGIARKPFYQYEIYPTYQERGEAVSARGHKPIVEEKEFLEILRKHLTPKILRRAEKDTNFLKPEDGLGLCFIHGEEKVIISVDDLEEISRSGKEKLILKNISRRAVKEFLEHQYSGKIMEENGKQLVNEEIKETDNLALGLSGSVVSSIIYPWKNFVPIDTNINEIMEEIYTKIIQNYDRRIFLKQKRRGKNGLGKNRRTNDQRKGLATGHKGNPNRSRSNRNDNTKTGKTGTNVIVARES